MRKGIDSLWGFPSFLCLLTSLLLSDSLLCWKLTTPGGYWGKRSHEEERSPCSTSRVRSWNTPASRSLRWYQSVHSRHHFWFKRKWYIYSYTQQNVFIHINTRKGVSRCPSSNLLRDVKWEKSSSPVYTPALLTLSSYRTTWQSPPSESCVQWWWLMHLLTNTTMAWSSWITPLPNDWMSGRKKTHRYSTQCLIQKLLELYLLLPTNNLSQSQ